MERKTIGSFIAALRRANGFTQAELAERLNVSDKTISRWERDESTPDLSLIPVLSEIFSVSADELLRGERLTADTLSIQNDKKEKQIKRITENTKTKFALRSIVSIGISLIGLTGAAIANFGFARSVIGFLVSLAFIITAIVCETAFTILAFSTINVSEFDKDAVNECKKSVFKTACCTFYLILTIFAFMLPLVFNVGFGLDRYLGLAWKSWLLYGFIFSAVSVILCLIINIFINRSAISKGLYSVNENELKTIKKKSTLTAKSLAVLAVLLAITAVTQLILNTAVSAKTLSESLVFDNYKDFVEFMETPAEDESFAEMTMMVQAEPLDSEIEEEYNTEYLYDAEGRILCEYINRNYSVSVIETSESENLLPITVYTDKGTIDGNRKLNQINSLLSMSYAIEIIAVAIIYLLKLKKIK